MTTLPAGSKIQLNAGVDTLLLMAHLSAEDVVSSENREEIRMKKRMGLAVLLCALLAVGAALAEPIPVTLSDSGVVCADPNVVSDGKTVVFPLAGEFELTGELSNGQIIVNCEMDEQLTLILNNVTIHNENGAAILVRQCTSKLNIVLADGSVNTLSDGGTYALDSNDEPNGVLFSKDDMAISGTGTLNITALYMDGIVCKDDLRIRSGNYNISAARNGIRGKDSLEIFDGVFNITAGNDGIKATNEKDAEKGYVAISGGEVHIVCGDDPVSVVTRLTITGGTVEATVDPSLAKDD